jgi:quercetin dioxygenase-like cupin family protein
MDEKEISALLDREGFAHIYVWEDPPNTVYPDHRHRMETAHIILAGEMSITTAGVTVTYKQGERCDVPAGSVHAAQIGPNGCRYLIGER